MLCGFVNTVALPKSAPLNPQATPPPLMHHNSPLLLKLMKLSKTIPFIIETQRLLTLGICPVEVESLLLGSPSPSSGKANTPIAFPPRDKSGSARSRNFG